METTLHFESMQNNFLGACASFDNCQLIYIVKFFRLCADIGVFVMKWKKISLAVNESEDRAHKSLSNDVICSVKAPEEIIACNIILASVAEVWYYWQGCQ